MNELNTKHTKLTHRNNTKETPKKLREHTYREEEFHEESFKVNNSVRGNEWKNTVNNKKRCLPLQKILSEIPEIDETGYDLEVSYAIEEDKELGPELHIKMHGTKEDLILTAKDLRNGPTETVLKLHCEEYALNDRHDELLRKVIETLN